MSRLSICHAFVIFPAAYSRFVNNPLRVWRLCRYGRKRQARQDSLSLCRGDCQGGIHVPVGVKVVEDGGGKSVLDATGHAAGFVVDSADGVVISGLTVKGA